MNGEINWGPPIECRGEKPARFEFDDAPVQWSWGGKPYQQVKARECRNFGSKSDFVLIRLPADHPHYATLSRATAPNGGEVGPEVVERMEALCRRMAIGQGANGEKVFPSLSSVDDYREARAIFALLPEPVDGDEAIAREIYEAADDRTGWPWERSVLGGKEYWLKIARAARRALEKEAGR